MGDMLSQAEIDALLGNVPAGDENSGDNSASDDSTGDNDSSDEKSGDNSVSGGDSSNAENSEQEGEEQQNFEGQEDISSQQETLTGEQKDILGEIGNISMGTAATTLFTLLGQKVLITTPQVSAMTWEQFSTLHDRPCVGIRVDYKEGLVGSNILILKEQDVKIIANLMMGGDGSNVEGELSEIDLSAIAEAMNQMVGSASTSLSTLIKMKIDIMTPNAFQIDFNDEKLYSNLGIDDLKEELVSISFKMEIGDLIDSQIMQMIPTRFALKMVDALKSEMAYSLPEEVVVPPKAQPAVQPETVPEVNNPVYQSEQPKLEEPAKQEMPQMSNSFVTPTQIVDPSRQQSVNVQNAQFQSFDYHAVAQQKENIGIIMDVPLEVTVELGRTSKLIKEILEFAPGTVVELDKLAGEPIDVFVNGKFVAKGEVVVIDENFGIRITDIVSVENRI